MGTRYIHLLHRYWERLQMLERTGGYYREKFRRERGMTQGEPLLPTILNVVVDSVVRHWELLVTETAGGDNRDENKAVQPTEGRTIRERDDR